MSKHVGRAREREREGQGERERETKPLSPFALQDGVRFRALEFVRRNTKDSICTFETHARTSSPQSCGLAAEALNEVRLWGFGLRTCGSEFRA